MRLAELRILASRWQIAALHLEGINEATPRPIDVVLGYRNERKVQKLAERSAGRLRVVDAASAYCRLRGDEQTQAELYALLKDLLRWPA